MTVMGWEDPETLGVTDAHNHLWIAPVPGLAAGVPQLFDRQAILEELLDYRAAGGGAIVDCQPGGCGRDGLVLQALSQASGVHVIASTGFHRRRYYPPDFWLFQADERRAADYFTGEIETGLVETIAVETAATQPEGLTRTDYNGNRLPNQIPGPNGEPVRAGLIKIACEPSLDETPAALLSATAEACRRTGAAIEVHTEKGSAAETILEYFKAHGIIPERLVICHIDKRPDLGLHRELAQEGVLLEYDTFYRSKYAPEKGVWPLIGAMLQESLDDRVALATDLAESELWARLGEGPGLTGFLKYIQPRLEALGCSPEVIARLMGGNITARLARPAG
jgi:phosphotriesterase-related protein